MVASAPKPESPSLSDLSISDLTHRLSPITHYPGTPPSVFTNWATTFRSQTQATFKPRSVDQVRWIVELARRQGKELRAAGAGHSPSDIVCTGGFVMDLRGLDKLLEVSCFSRISPNFFQSARSSRYLQIVYSYRLLTLLIARPMRKRILSMPKEVLFLRISILNSQKLTSRSPPLARFQIKLSPVPSRLLLTVLVSLSDHYQPLLPSSTLSSLFPTPR